MFWMIAQTRPTPEQVRAMEALTRELLVALLVLVVVVVVVMLLLRKHYRNALRTLRQPEKPTHMEDLWFENPIERKGRDKDKTPPPAGQP